MITLTQSKWIYSFQSKAKYLLGGSKGVYCSACRCFSEGQIDLDSTVIKMQKIVIN